MNLTLKQKTWIFILLFTSVTLLAIILIVNYLYEQYYIESQVNQLMARGNSLEEVYYESEDGDHEEFHNLASFMSRCAAASIIYDASDEMLEGRLPAGIPLVNEHAVLPPEDVERLNANETLVLKKEGYESDYLIIINPLMNAQDGMEGAVVLSTPVTDTFAPFQTAQGLVFAGLAGAFLVIVFVLKTTADYVINPIGKMMTASRAVAQGDFTSRIDVRNKDEIGQLAGAFNSMSASLDEADKKKQEFLGNVSHELRTPLSYLKGYSEVLLEQKEKGDPLDTKYLERIQAEGNRMEGLIHDLLDLARLEGDSYPVTLAPIPFAQLVEDVAERMQITCEKRGVELRTNLDYSAIINGDEKRVEQVVINLVENAIRYGNEGKHIDLDMAVKGKMAELRVTDYGEGIPEDALKQLTDRFYRLDKSRSRASGGTGLGLTIVKEIMKKHNGELRFESVYGEGLTAIVTFPLFEG